MVVTASRISRITNYGCKQTAPLFGDMGTVTILAPTGSEKYPVHFELVHARAGMQTAERVFFDYHVQENVPLPTPDGGRDCVPRRLVFSLDGMGIAEAAPRAMAASTAKALKETHIQPDEVQYLVPHQAGTGIVSLCRDEVGGDRHPRGSDQRADERGRQRQFVLGSLCSTENLEPTRRHRRLPDGWRGKPRKCRGVARMRDPAGHRRASLTPIKRRCLLISLPAPARAATLLLFWLRKPHHQPLLRRSVGKMDERRARILREVADSRLHDRPLLTLDGPGDALARLVGHPFERLCLISFHVLNVPAMTPCLLMASCMNKVGSAPEAWPSCVSAKTPSGSHSPLSGVVAGRWPRWRRPARHNLRPLPPAGRHNRPGRLRSRCFRRRRNWTVGRRRIQSSRPANPRSPSDRAPRCAMRPSRDYCSRSPFAGGFRPPDCGLRRAAPDGCLAIPADSQRGRPDFRTYSGGERASPPARAAPAATPGRAAAPAAAARDPAGSCDAAAPPPPCRKSAAAPPPAGGAPTAPVEAAGTSRKLFTCPAEGRAPAEHLRPPPVARPRPPLPRPRCRACSTRRPCRRTSASHGPCCCRRPALPRSLRLRAALRRHLPPANGRPRRAGRAPPPPPPRPPPPRARMSSCARRSIAANAKRVAACFIMSSPEVCFDVVFGNGKTLPYREAYSLTISTSSIFGRSSPPAVRSMVCQVNEFKSTWRMTLTIEALRPSARMPLFRTNQRSFFRVQTPSVKPPSESNVHERMVLAAGSNRQSACRRD